MVKVFILVFTFIDLFFANSLLYSQQFDTEKLERIFDKISETTNTIPSYDQLETLIENPVILNKSSAEELNKIPGMSFPEIQKIINYISENKILTYSGIYEVVNLNPDERYLFELCTRIGTTYSTKSNNKFNERSRANQQLQQAAGFVSGDFQGTPLTLYNRMSICQDGLKGNIITDKDAGEISLIDFYSFNLSEEFTNTKIILGDFYVESGMGSILWSSYGFTKGAETVSPAVHFGSGINENKSSMENEFFRGAAIQNKFSLGNDFSIKSILWASSTNRSGTLDSTGELITSVYTLGYYRTESEILRRNAFNEKSAGGNIEINSPVLNLGFTALGLKYDKTIQSSSKSSFLGNEGLLFSAYTFLNFEKAFICGELSSDAQGNLGIKSSLMFPSNEVDAVVNFRYFPSDFRSPYGYNFGENNFPNNETGIYSGINIKSIKNINLSMYVDFFRNIDSTNLLPGPGKGFDIFTDVKWYFLPDVNFSGRVEYKNQSDLAGDGITIFQKEHLNLRLELEKQFNNRTTVRGRIATVLATFHGYKPKELGMMGYLDVTEQIFDFVNFGGRITYFSTDSYESAIWQFEPALPGYFTSTALYGEGMRAYINLNFVAWKNIGLTLRYAILSKNNINSMGSGTTAINGNQDERLFFQLDIKL
ncbi:MAG: hypothetical protein ABSG15_02460 [FCB group bacterium]|jgi:hypothetical protein